MYPSHEFTRAGGKCCYKRVANGKNRIEKFETLNHQKSEYQEKKGSEKQKNKRKRRKSERKTRTNESNGILQDSQFQVDLRWPHSSNNQLFQSALYETKGTIKLVLREEKLERSGRFERNIESPKKGDGTCHRMERKHLGRDWGSKWANLNSFTKKETRLSKETKEDEGEKKCKKGEERNRYRL